MALLFLFVLVGALLSAPWKEWPCFKWRKVICLSKGRSSSSPSAFFFFNVAYTILLCLFLLHIPIRPSFSPHINPRFHPSLWWNSSINQPASEGRLHSAPCCSKGNDGVQVWLLWQQYHCYTSSSQRSLEIRCHTKSAAFNSMIIWPAVGLWSIAATVRIHTHTHTLSFTPTCPFSSSCIVIYCVDVCSAVRLWMLYRWLQSLWDREPSFPSSPSTGFIWDKLQATEASRKGERVGSRQY